MPYKSQRQRRFFHYAEKAGKMPKDVVDEFDEASRGKNLPEEAPGMFGGGDIEKFDEESSHSHPDEIGHEMELSHRMFGGGKAGDDSTEDNVAGSFHPYNSSGEPHTNDYFETEHPMEFMAMGGFAPDRMPQRPSHVPISGRPRSMGVPQSHRLHGNVPPRHVMAEGGYVGEPRLAYGGSVSPDGELGEHTQSGYMGKDDPRLARGGMAGYARGGYIDDPEQLNHSYSGYGKYTDGYDGGSSGDSFSQNAPKMHGMDQEMDSAWHNSGPEYGEAAEHYSGNYAKGGKAKLGSGKRFEHLTHQLAGKGAKDPKALAAYIGRKKYGSAKMAKLSAHGKKAAHGGKMGHGLDGHAAAFAKALKKKSAM